MYNLEKYYADIPTGKENAVTYLQLKAMWNCSERKVRTILHELSRYDNNDDYILIRSSAGKGFYKTDNIAEIERYKRECTNRAKHTFAPLRKINRILRFDETQYNFFNNLKSVRLSLGMKQEEVCEMMQKYDKGFDVPLLSRYENGKSLPTPFQLAMLAQIYGVDQEALISGLMAV